MRPVGGLGKGLGALIPGGRPAISEVGVGEIVPNPRQPRHEIDPAALEDLVASIRQHGVLQPLVVADAGEGEPRYQLIAGERRWRAAKAAGLTRVPVVVKEATPQEMLEIALVENIQRADLNPLEEAAAYRQLVGEFGLTQERVAERVGRNRVSVTNSLRLLALPETVKEALAARRITEGHARALLGLAEPIIGTALARIVAEGLSVRETEELVRRGGAKRVKRGGRVPTPEVKALEEELRGALATKVNLYRTAKGGKVVIHFYSDEELDALYQRLVR